MRPGARRRPTRAAGGRIAPSPGLAAGLLLLATIGAGCRDRASGDGGPPAGPRPGPTARPSPGPRFVDRAPEFGLDVTTTSGSPEKGSILESLGVGVALLDFDGDDDPDLFVAPGSRVDGGRVEPSGGPWLFRNDGPGRWVDVSAPSGLAHRGWAQGVAVSDYDADGDPDLFVAQHGPDLLWENLGDGTFRDVTGPSGLGDEPYWGVAATWGDADGDGWPDLYVTNYVAVDPASPHPPVGHRGGPVPVFAGPESYPGEPDVLWRNRGDGTFEDATESAGLLKADRKGMGALFADLDADGDQDLFVTNDTQANEFFRNRGDGTFEEEGRLAGVALGDLGRAEGSMGIDLADLDLDGWLDLAYSNFYGEGSRVFISHGGRTFSDVSHPSTVTVATILRVGWGIVLADFDHDGLADLFQANGHVYPGLRSEPYDQPPVLLRNAGGRRFEDATASWISDPGGLSSGRSVAVGDLDGDGDLDLVMTTMDGPLRVLVNEGERSGRSLILRLVGAPPNLEALGAIAELRAGGTTHVATVRRGGSFMAASDSALHFGLGDADSLTSLRVRWPDGTTSDYPGEDLPVDSRITIRQGDPRVVSTPFEPAGRP
ncbi:CRTAC1 family protein [Tautonia plasticadhaerens]|uniref:FG-GAP repeat protein n=1 Tax=Tautonia plasticadhaerens TaxID=2527974 RepID=A0A518HDK4_9BACT|nr:CRTAC1 family protein [Tautonia plasticadhaerens]QDV38938.1 FG-GAP repeat protein [Tautonia plasticadhaerens]